MPATEALTPAASVTQFPGQLGVVNFQGLSALGYRWYQSNAVTPAFAFGYGLSYSTFSWSQISVARAGTGVNVSLDVTNTSHRSGVDVVQVYVNYPGATGEPPEQLRGFERVELAPGTSRHVVVTLPHSAFTYDSAHGMIIANGSYGVNVATSSADVVSRQSIRFQ
jgi:beta-glucosidase